MGKNESRNIVDEDAIVCHIYLCINQVDVDRDNPVQHTQFFLNMRYARITILSP